MIQFINQLFNGSLLVFNLIREKIDLTKKIKCFNNRL